MTGNNKKSRPNWSELNQELLGIIASKLLYLDIIRFKAVCSSWFAAAERYSSPGPLLLCPLTRETDAEHVRLGACSIKDGTIYDLNLEFEKPEDVFSASDGFRFIGSSHGWMVAEDKGSELYLMNVFSRTCIPLPEKGTIPTTQSYGPKFSMIQSPTMIQKAILTANPSLDENYKVIIIYGCREKLAFCGFGDREWVRFSNSDGYDDVVCYDTLLYALREGQIEVWEISDSRSPTKKICLECCYTTDSSYPREICCTQWYLAPSLGELLLIERFIGEFVDDQGQLHPEGDLLTDEDSHPLLFPYKTFSFQVYKLNMIEKKLEKVTSLKDQVIFLGGNHGISLSVKDYPEFMPNSIYYTDDYWDRMHEDYLYGGHDFGSYSLEENSIASLVPYCVERFDPTPFWVLPN
ncbi:putative F-box protein At5g55150 [Coffea eugenioides]|uniref:putative F-box protein At5g55150 n=1 Tax=Coffea eugenioides TaxID=49369 RepID=UPI000F60D0FA|nr:putative F-box protein At5g55150 [Coffea eugenioides]